MDKSIKTNKDNAIETLRGIAIFIVVVGHVIGSAPDGGMRIEFPSPFRYLYLWIDYIQMPLFTAIAGWAYAIKPIEKTNLILFIKDKFNRLIVPLYTVSTCYFLVQWIIPGTNNQTELSDIWRIYFFPYTLYWYLQSLFLIFTFIIIIEKKYPITTTNSWFCILGVSIISYILEVNIITYAIPNIFSFKGALKLFPYFIVGLGIKRFREEIYPFKKRMIIPFIIGLILLQAKWFYRENLPINLYETFRPLWLIPTLILLLSCQYKNKIFTYLGNYAYTIYLFHGFSTSGGRIILPKFKI